MAKCQDKIKRFLPKELNELIEKVEILREKPLNFNLYLNKYAIFTQEEGKYKAKIEKSFEHFIKKFGTPRNRRYMLPIDLFPLQYFQNYLSRLKAVRKTLTSYGYSVRSKTFKILWRFIIGLGSPSIYECSLCLNRNYSVPLIPGSAVKGVTNHYAKNRVTDEEHSRIFGLKTLQKRERSYFLMLFQYSTPKMIS